VALAIEVTRRGLNRSIGTTMFWVSMETQPLLNERIEMMIGLAPVASVAQMKSPIKVLTPYFRQLEVPPFIYYHLL